MIHRGPFQPLPFCDSVMLLQWSQWQACHSEVLQLLTPTSKILREQVALAAQQMWKDYPRQWTLMRKRSHLWKSFASSHFLLEPGSSHAGKGHSSAEWADQAGSPGADWKCKRRLGDGELPVKSWGTVAELHGITHCLCSDTKQIAQDASG